MQGQLYQFNLRTKNFTTEENFERIPGQVQAIQEKIDAIKQMNDYYKSHLLRD